MNHWELAGSMAAEHRADLDREAASAELVARIRSHRAAGTPTWQATIDRIGRMAAHLPSALIGLARSGQRRPAREQHSA
jgi:hypothetical protein